MGWRPFLGSAGDFSFGDINWLRDDIRYENMGYNGLYINIFLYNLTHMMMFYEVSGMCPVKCLFQQSGDGMNDGK